MLRSSLSCNLSHSHLRLTRILLSRYPFLSLFSRRKNVEEKEEEEEEEKEFTKYLHQFFRLYGNPLCADQAQADFVNCQPHATNPNSGNITSSRVACQSCSQNSDFEYNPLSPISCICAMPLGVGLRLKSPGISDFQPYIEDFRGDLSSRLDLHSYQVYFNLYTWEEGPRLNMHLNLFPDETSIFNTSEVMRIRRMLTGWEITLSDVFGPYELLNFRLGSYANMVPALETSTLSKGALVGIVLGSMAVAAIISSTIVIVIMLRRSRHRVDSKRRASSRTAIKLHDVKGFLLEEMKHATDNFSNSSLVGHGGYGKVYRGILADGTVVAIKRAHEGSLQGSNEFATEIVLLSRLHHRNLVSLVGYCDEEDEQMLIYEFMSNGSLRDLLSPKSKEPLSFIIRLHIAMEIARGIHYLHAEVDPPIFHRDIKASNILLDSKYSAKVADFGISRLAPLPNVQGISPDSTVVKGTPGYLDPEYLLTHKLTDKSDVYSVGVVFLELVTGMQPISFGKNLVREVSMAYRSGKTYDIIDSRMGSYPSHCIDKFTSLAYNCCQEQPDARPSMGEIVRELENIWEMMPEDDVLPCETEKESAPLFSAFSSSTSTSSYLSYDVSSSNLQNNPTPNIKFR